MKMENSIEAIVAHKYDKTMKECTTAQIYYAVLDYVKECTKAKEQLSGEKKLYYISAEFLIGKLLSNNLINLGIYQEVKEVLEKNGFDIAMIEDVEPEPSLGNGGLGRLAACFLDSIATLGLSGDGVGLNYHYGLFKQRFVDHLQKEEKNDWIEDTSWLQKTDTKFSVSFGPHTVQSRMYDIDVVGYKNGINKLHLFDIETIDESIVKEGIDFDQENIDKNLTLFLYPDDSTKQGELLRIYQQYFMVSSAAQLILLEEREKGHDIRKLHKHVTIQINDTHPSLVIPELISLLMKEGIHMDEAVAIVRKTCAYTNHTILSEALEKWPIEFLEQVVPHLIGIIEALQLLVREQFDDARVQIIDDQNRVHMAHIDMHFGYSVNGVAALHTDILKNTELKPFYDIYPEKFNNKTNGITFRRWLLHCNHDLSAFITSLIGDGFTKDANELKKLEAYIEDENVLSELRAIKLKNKTTLKNFLFDTQGIEINEHSIFDIQIKRLHEYKRQQMNALYIIYKYLEIKKGVTPSTPMTFIFGAKAAPAYTIAKDIIHLLLCLQTLIDKDPEVSKHMKLVVVENYNVTKAEKLIPACDISEQISLASKEASGTGNMKFMLNGAVTLGTRDGANVEIEQLVKAENIYTFGQESEQVIAHYEKADYSSNTIYKTDLRIHTLVDFIISDELLAIGHAENLTRLHSELLNKDWFMTLLDLDAYIKVKDQMLNDYSDQQAWAKMSLVNIANAGFFSSDRTIAQYNKDIWKLK